MAQGQGRPRHTGPRAKPPFGRPRRSVVILLCPGSSGARAYERVTHYRIAEALAELRGWTFAGEYDATRRYPDRLYFVPTGTVAGLELARRLGIRGPQDLFGGVVPYAFVANKTITHPLFTPGAPAPAGWTPAFAARVAPVVLPGFSAFDAESARRAGRQLLRDGPVRVKRAWDSGGTGQATVGDEAQLDASLRGIGDEQWRRGGIVLERHLAQPVTRSVGQLRLGGMLASYFGTQQLTRTHEGEMVYGGSRLTVVRGDFDTLLALAPQPQIRIAVEQARAYHEAALDVFAGMFASRANCDVAQGEDSAGHWRSGVLEASWRVGGATGAEIAALRAFRSDPSLQLVVASTTEVYDAQAPVPPDATVYYRGVDPQAGALTKYARLEARAHADA